jgi:DNA-binding transcriptional MerR regulator
MSERAAAAARRGARLSIGALARATGIPVETLRTWEGRYGYPVPERRPSGHRVYPVSSVPRLRRIAEVLARGHRAAQVVPATEAELDRLLDASGRAAARPIETLVPAAEALTIDDLLRLVGRFDGERLTRVLLGDWARLGPLPFLETRIAPLVRAVGDAWEAGRLEIRHEHFISERVGDLLRSLRLPFEERATGRLAVLATLPGEQHTLGLQMAALTLAAAGWRALFLGGEAPVAEVAALTRDLGASATAISVSRASDRAAARAGLRALRSRLPRRTALLAGGEGAPAAPGIIVHVDLRSLDAWARSPLR